MPISIDLTQYVVNGDGSINSLYPLGDKPLGGGPATISSFTGTFGQGNSIELTASNVTTKNTTQLLFFTGDPAENGNDANTLLQNQPVSNASNYKHTTTKSYMGSGASILASMASSASGSVDPYIDLGSPQDAIYFSTVLNLNVNTAGLDTESQQLKMQRLTGNTTSSSSPALGRTFFWGTDDVNITDSFGTMFTGGGPSYEPADRRLWELGLLGDKWLRTQMYWRASSLDTANGSLWFMDSNETDGVTYLSARGAFPDYEDFNDPDASNPNIDISTWNKQWTPMNKHITRRTSDSANQSMQVVWLPFFKRDSSQVDSYIDGIYVNNSCERVELGDASTWETCTKRVIQKQTNRTSSSVTFECYEANFAPTDNIYAFIFNEFGEYSTGHLIRAAS